MSPRSGGRVARPSHGGPVFHLLVHASLAGACLVVAVSLSARPRGLRIPVDFFAVLAANALSLLAVQGCLWLLLRPALRRFGIDGFTLALAIGAAALGGSLLVPVTAVIWGLLDSLQRTALAVTSTILLVPVPVLGALVGIRWCGDAAGRDGMTRASAMLAWTGAVGLAALWLAVFRSELSRSPQGWALYALLLALVPAGGVLARRWDPFRAAWPGLVAIALLVVAGWIPRTRAEVAPAVSEGERPSILFVSADTLRADALRPYRPDASEKPNLESLFEDSLVFLEARTPAPWTKPAFASVMTGLSPLAHRVDTRTARFPLELETLAERMKGAGYATAGMGSNPFLTPAFQFDQGFDEYKFAPRYLGPSPGRGLLGLLWPADFATDLSTEDLSDLAVAWLERHRDSRFFLWLHYIDPHMPYAPSESWRPEKAPPGDLGFSFHGLGPIRTGHHAPSRAERQWIRELYDAEVRELDAGIGRVLEALKRLGRHEATLIVFFSDHGEEFWEHEGFEHGHSVYEELLRVPLSIKLPAPGKSGRIADAVSITSLAPTLLELAGIDFDAGAMTAPSLVPLWSGAERVTQENVSTGGLYYGQKTAVVFDRWKYIYLEESEREELYDLERDPGEQRSIEGEAMTTARAILESARRSGAKVRGRLGIEIDEVDEVDELDSNIRDALRELGYVE